MGVGHNWMQVVSSYITVRWSVLSSAMIRRTSDIAYWDNATRSRDLHPGLHTVSGAIETFTAMYRWQLKYGTFDRRRACNRPFIHRPRALQ